MGRKRKFKMKINNKTIGNIIGFLIIASSIVVILSFFQLGIPETQGILLKQFNRMLIAKLGFLSIVTPFLAIMIALHLFNSKKLQFIKPNITAGLSILLVSLLGIFQSGEIGKFIYDILVYNISVIGGMAVFLVLSIIGLILLFDTSIDAFFLALFTIMKNIAVFVKTYLFRTLFTNKPKDFALSAKKQGKEENAFIQDKKIETSSSTVNKPVLPIVSPKPISSSTTVNKDFVIKPISTLNSSTWIYPPLNLLSDIKQTEADRGDVNNNASIIERTLDSFGVRARVAEVNYGPAVTQYAIEITMGTKLSKITALAGDLALALAASTGTVRIEAPIPGRALVGIEIPNRRLEVVSLKRMLSQDIFSKNTDPLLVPLGLDVSGQAQATSIAKMPHCLIAGTTGSGKSVILNAWICTFLFRTKPEELRLILVDPKRVELSGYNGIPHLLTEVIVEPEKTIKALRWTVAEMETRYKEFAKVHARNLESYNQIEGIEKKPYIIFVIDELAELMIFAPGDVETLITRIAQLARATGIHLILATQRPSVNVITGLMKANIPTRLAFNVSSMIDSRVIIDMPGAEKLLGKGDMLFLPPDQAKPRRIQGPFMTEKEVQHLVQFLRSQVPEVHYTEEITEAEATSSLLTGTSGIGGDDKDPFFNQAVEIISQFDKASASLLQRRLKVGYARAARLLDELHEAGFIGPAEGSKPREVLKRTVNQEIATQDTASM